MFVQKKIISFLLLILILCMTIMGCSDNDVTYIYVSEKKEGAEPDIQPELDGENLNSNVKDNTLPPGSDS